MEAEIKNERMGSVVDITSPGPLVGESLLIFARILFVYWDLREKLNMGWFLKQIKSRLRDLVQSVHLLLLLIFQGYFK